MSLYEKRNTLTAPITAVFKSNTRPDTSLLRIKPRRILVSFQSLTKFHIPVVTDVSSGNILIVLQFIAIVTPTELNRPSNRIRRRKEQTRDAFFPSFLVPLRKILYMSSAYISQERICNLLSVTSPVFIHITYTCHPFILQCFRNLHYSSIKFRKFLVLLHDNTMQIIIK